MSRKWSLPCVKMTTRGREPLSLGIAAACGRLREIEGDCRRLREISARSRQSRVGQADLTSARLEKLFSELRRARQSSAKAGLAQVARLGLG